eukprot:3885603-Prymnesium_polylepis.1
MIVLFVCIACTFRRFPALLLVYATPKQSEVSIHPLPADPAAHDDDASAGQGAAAAWRRPSSASATLTSTTKLEGSQPRVQRPQSAQPASRSAVPAPIREG